MSERVWNKHNRNLGFHCSYREGMTKTPFFRRHSLPLGALAVLAVVVTSGCGVQQAKGDGSWAVNTNDSVTETVSQAAQVTASEETPMYKPVTYDDAVSKFGMSVDKNAFGAYAGEGLIGFRFGDSGIFLGMFDADPADDRGVVSDVLASEAN
jgi:hypothetical protein